MKNLIVAVRDTAMDQFARPFSVPTTAIAIRSFTDEVNRADENNQMFRHPEDFELWALADFDDQTGKFDNNEPRMLLRARDVKQEN